MNSITLFANEPYHRIAGGISRFLRELGPRLAERFQVNLGVIGAGTRLEMEKLSPTLKIYHFPHYPLSVGSGHPPKFPLRETRELVAASDLIFVQSSECFVPLYYTWRLRKPFVMYFHGIDWETFPNALGWKWLGRRLVPLVRAYTRYWYNRVDRLLIPSKDMEPVLGRAGIRSPRSIVPLGVDGESFPQAPDRNRAKEKLGISPQDTVIGYTGRLAREKNVGFLLAAFETLQKKYPNLKLLLVGSGVQDFQETIAKNPAILAVGQQNDVLPYLHAMDLFCMPSETETSSLSSMEAMTAGIPVVAYDVGCLRNYLRHEQSGLLALAKDAADYRRQVEKLLRSPVLREEMGNRAYEAMRNRPTWEQTATAMAGIIEEILSERNSEKISECVHLPASR